MLTATKIAGFIGAGLAGAAYVPQIWHLVRVRCSAGVSRLAFWVWLLASMLVLTHAIAVRAEVFIILGGVQSAATTLILVYATKYRSSYCVGHMPADLGGASRTEVVTGRGGKAGPSSMSPQMESRPTGARLSA